MGETMSSTVDNRVKDEVVEVSNIMDFQIWEEVDSTISICIQLMKFSETSLEEEILLRISLMTMMIFSIVDFNQWDLEECISRWIMAEATIIDNRNNVKTETHSADLVCKCKWIWDLTMKMISLEAEWVAWVVWVIFHRFNQAVLEWEEVEWVSLSAHKQLSKMENKRQFKRKQKLIEMETRPLKSQNNIKIRTLAGWSKIPMLIMDSAEVRWNRLEGAARKTDVIEMYAKTHLK